MSAPLRADDPAAWMLNRGRAEDFARAMGQEIPEDQRWTSTPEAYRDGCYICEDDEFRLMGLPLCKFCPVCTEKAGVGDGHVPADDTVCDSCGHDTYPFNDKEI